MGLRLVVDFFLAVGRVETDGGCVGVDDRVLEFDGLDGFDEFDDRFIYKFVG